MKKVYGGAPEAVRVEYHADDFGLFPAQSRRILDCHAGGLLNGVSIMPNSPHLDSCMAMLGAQHGAIARTVHLNLIEGRCLCAPEEVPLLADENGVFRVHFGRLLLRSFLPGKRAWREQLKKELRAQIRTVAAYWPEGEPLRLDGHAHYHMLPLVFDALMDVIREDGLAVSYIRIPREHVSLYLRHWKSLREPAPINLVKVCVLNLLAWRNTRKYRAVLEPMEQRLFMGVFLSGRMYRENVEPLLPDALRLAQSLGQDLEILAHPGGVFEEGDIAQLTNREDIAFLTSPRRRKEAALFDTVPV